jgi:hypothetical protein
MNRRVNPWKLYDIESSGNGAFFVGTVQKEL